MHEGDNQRRWPLCSLQESEVEILATASSSAGKNYFIMICSKVQSVRKTKAIIIAYLKCNNSLHFNLLYC